MSWTDEYIRDLRGRLAEAKRQGLWVSARDVQFVRHMLSWWTKASMAGWARPNDGMLPSIAWMRKQGVTHLFVTCETRNCHQSRRVALDDLHRPPGRQPVPEQVAFNDLPNICRWRCLKCGSRRVSIMAHWPVSLPGPYSEGGASRIPLNEVKKTWGEDE